MTETSKVAFSGVVLLSLVLTWGGATALASTQTLFYDNFNSYDPNLQLAGQGGWFQDPNFTAPLMLSTSTPLGPTVAIDGLHRTGTGQYNGSSIALLEHSLSGPLNSNGTSISSVDAWAFNAYRSHGAGMFLDSADHLTQIEFYASWYPGHSPAWTVVLSLNGSAVYQDYIYGSFDELAHLEIVIDGAAGDYYGRLTSANGVFLTPTHPITSSEIAQLTQVSLLEDFRDSLYLGADMDNVLVTTTTSSVPEPSSLALLGVGLLGIARRARGRVVR